MFTKLKLHTRTLVPWLTVLLILIGSVISYYGFSNEIKKTKLDRTLKFQENFYNNNLHDYFIEVFATWKKEESANLKQHFNELNEITLKNLPEIRRKVVIDKIKKNDQLANKLGKLSDFFNDLKVCVDKKLCDKELADSFFKKRIEKFDKIFSSYLEN